MKVATIGSRNLEIDISKYIPKETSEIISDGAEGVDMLTEAYADKNGIEKDVAFVKVRRCLINVLRMRLMYP